MSIASTARSGCTGKDGIERGVIAMTDCSSGVMIISISSSLSGKVADTETDGELDEELLGVSTLSLGVIPRFFFSSDTARSIISKSHGCDILERFSFAEGSKLCILNTVSKLYYQVSRVLSGKYIAINLSE